MAQILDLRPKLKQRDNERAIRTAVKILDSEKQRAYEQRQQNHREAIEKLNTFFLPELFPPDGAA